MKPGDTVESLIDMQPLRKGDQGTVKEINHQNTFPITVYFPSLTTTLPLRYNKVKLIK